MKRPRFRESAVAVAFLLSVSMAWWDVAAIVVTPPPSKQFVAQTWLGFSPDDRYMLRLQLSSSGTGQGVLMHLDGTVEPFDVVSWRLAMYDLHLEIHFKDADLQAAQLSGAIKSSVLSYTSTGPLQPGDPMRKIMDPAPNALPGPLELLLTIQESHIRFGAWPEKELNRRLQQLGEVSKRQAP